MEANLRRGILRACIECARTSIVIAAITSTLVTVQALLLVALELRARRHATASIVGPRQLSRSGRPVQPA
jgi:hypothetical protein